MFANAVVQIARKELIQHFKTARLLTVGVFFLLALVLTTLVLPLTFENAFDFDIARGTEEGMAQNAIFGIFLGASLIIPFIGGVFYVALVSIVLTADAVTSEWQRRSIFLVLSKPVPRAAFVLGKFIGAFVALLVPLVLLSLIDYTILIMVFDGVPSGEAFLRFLGAVGILLLGGAAYGAMALLVSTLVRSSVAAFILALGVWIVVLPLAGVPGDVLMSIDSAQNDGDVDPSDWKYEAFRLISPGDMMGSAAKVVLDLDADEVGFGGNLGPARTWLSPIVLAGQTILYVGLATLVVQRRNFE